MSEWKKVKIGDFLKRKKEPIEIKSNEKYKLLTVRLYHKGVELRCEKLGSEIQSKMYKVSKGDFILSGIDARNGAFGIVPNELDEAVVTNDFWYFEIDESVVKKDFFFWVTKTPIFLDVCRKASMGETQRIRLQKDLFFNYEINCPAIDFQENFVNQMNLMICKIDRLQEEIEKQKSYAKQLRQNILQEAIEGKLTADWRKQNPVQKGNPNYDAEALFEKIQTEKQKKGKKQKPLPAITEAEKPFAIPSDWKWVRLGEICFNIEGGKSILCKEIVPNKNEIGIVKTGVCSFGYFKEDECKTCLSPKDWHDEYAIHKGDFLIGRANTLELVGSCVIVDKIERKLMLSDKILRINFDEMICSDFILCAMKSKYVREQIERSATGSSPTMKNISQESIKNYSLPLPPLAEQKEIVARVEKYLQTITQLEIQIATRETTTKQLMQSILKTAFEEK